MLTITVLGDQHFNEATSEVYTVGDVVIELEYSLAALSKWEQIHKKPFISETSKTPEEQLDFIKCMTLTPNIPDDVFNKLSMENLHEIKEYVEDDATATWFSDNGRSPKSREVITSELIYYWMFSAEIDKECEHWHLNRLFTLIKIYNLKNAKPEKMSRAELARRNREENARRKALYGTRG